jgi:hypothetical protein
VCRLRSGRGGFPAAALAAAVTLAGSALLGLAVPLLATAGELMALPGLWKTTARLVEPSQRDPEVNWHCVDEVQDPWSAYAQIALLAGDMCKQTKSERTGTTLAWTVECKGPVALVGNGQVVFDSASHYRGEVELSGTFMGYPVSNRISVEGQRYAACTSPRD